MPKELETELRRAFMAGWNAGLRRTGDSFDAKVAFAGWQLSKTKAHKCRCAQCDHVWHTKKYPSPCPKCKFVWT